MYEGWKEMDLVAELSRWLDKPDYNHDLRPLVQAARDEIIKLRESQIDIGTYRKEWLEIVIKTRADALEEVAKIAEGFAMISPSPIGPAHGAGWSGAAIAIAEAIRKLAP